MTRMGILLALLLPSCFSAKDQYMCRSRQAEAQTNLAGLRTQQETYKMEKGKYASSMTELGFAPAASKYYDLTIDSATATTFSATATGKGDSAGDVWTIDQAGKASAKTDKCHSK